MENKIQTFEAVYQFFFNTVALSLDNIKVWINEKIAEQKAKEAALARAKGIEE